MSKLHAKGGSIQISNPTFDDLQYEDISDDRRKRDMRLQDRRWHLLQQAAHDREFLDLGRSI